MNRYDIILGKEPLPSPEEKIYGESILADYMRHSFKEHLLEQQRSFQEHYFGNWNWPGINSQE
jgi:hypothetical protein